MKKRILAVFISICLFIGLSSTALAADTDLNIIDGNIDIQTSGSYNVTQSDTDETNNRITIKSDVTADVTINSLNIKAENGPAILVEAGANLNLTVVGENTLIGADGFAAICVMPAYDGDGNYVSDTSAELTIDGTGELFATGGEGGAGIGGNEFDVNISMNVFNINSSSVNNVDFGIITINGGNITATGGTLGAGIGGSSDSNGGYIYINGGTIVATGGSPDGAMGAAGIGGGDNSSVHEVEIRGGNVTAIASGGAAGIGGGTNTSYGFQYGDMNGTRDNFGKILISGEDTVVEAVGGTGNGSSGTFGGAGIGAGYPAANNGRSVAFDISIKDGATVNAYGGYHAQAIGYGYRPSGSLYYTGYGICLKLDDSITLWAQNQDCFQPALVAETEYDNAPVQYESENGTKLICFTAESADLANTASGNALSYTKLPGAAEDEEWELEEGKLTVGSTEVKSGLGEATLGNWATLLAAPLPQHEVSYDLNSGDANGGDYSTVTVNQGDVVIIKDAPVRSDYVFDGWSDGDKIWQPGDELIVMDNVILTAQWHENGGEIITHILHYESNGGTAYEDEPYSENTVVELNKAPTREGYQFIGWYADKELNNPVVSIKMTSDKTVYAGWLAATVPDMLNGKDHFAYVMGYNDGTVRPLVNIKRAETASIFFRLLNSDIRDENLTNTNTFTDVKDGMWCNTAISTLMKLGIVKGRTPDSFEPGAAITRAEFVVICARFDTVSTDGASYFTDISGHWAEEEINHAAALGWIQGVGGGKFNPKATITRAEAMTIINRMLCRIPENEQDLLEGMKVWPDNPSGAWYYLAVQEATNSHDFTRKGETYEQWTALKEDHNDWKKYE